MRRFLTLLTLGMATAATVSTSAWAQSSASAAEGVRAAPSSFAARATSGQRSRFGFSVGVRDSYASDSPTALSGGEVFATVTPRVFGSLRGRTAEMAFGYGVGYNRYDRSNGTSSNLSHQLDFNVRKTYRRWSIFANDAFSSSVNDYGVLLGGPQPPVGAALAFDIPRQRVTQNSVSTGFEVRPSQKASITASARYDYRFYEQRVNDNQDVEATIQSQYKVNNWLFLNNSYTNLFTSPTQQVNSAIHRMQFGGLEFRSRRGWALSIGGGLEASQQEGGHLVQENVEVGLTKMSESTVLSLRVHHGLSRPVHSESVLLSNDLSGSVVHWFSRRISFRMAGGYTRGKTESGPLVKSFSGGASMGFQLQEHLVLSADASYNSQNVPSSVATPRSSRYTVGAGLEFFFPSLNSR